MVKTEPAPTKWYLPGHFPLGVSQAESAYVTGATSSHPIDGKAGVTLDDLHLNEPLRLFSLTFLDVTVFGPAPTTPLPPNLRLLLVISNSSACRHSPLKNSPYVLTKSLLQIQ